MPKIQFSDVVPPEKRSIRNIPIPASGKRVSKPAPEIVAPAPTIKIEQVTASIPTPNIYKKPDQPYYHEDRLPSRTSGKKFVYGGIAIVLVAAFIGVMMTVFASANVAIIPKKENLSVQMSISASREIGGASDTVPYEVIRLSKTKSVEVAATGEEMVERKASGKIIIYNNFSSEPQRLITRTRFETKDGLIYRIPESITIPGKTATGPGQIEVEVFADEAGAKYNIGKTEFTVPGFKNDTERFSGFYAKSATEISGGLVGKVKKVEESARQSALSTLESDLQSETEKEISTQIGEGLVFLPGGIIYEFRELPQQDSGSGASLGKEVTALAILLKESSLSDKITSNYLGTSEDWSGIPFVVEGFDSLKIVDKPSSIEAGSTLNLKLEGVVTAVAKVDEAVVSEALSGLPRSSIAEAMRSFRGIDSIKATIRPMWKKSFPESAAKIHVDIE